MLVGLDVLRRSKNSTARRRLVDARFALLSHAAAVDEKGRSTLDVLGDLDLTPELVLSPEHGWDGVAQAEEPVVHDHADTAEVAVKSLYGDTKASLQPRAEDLADLDLLVIDLCDVGARYYTYIWTALLAAQAARDAGVHTLVLDRPNPLGGSAAAVEGRLQDAEMTSFVGLEPVPVRHSLTIGEMLTGLFNQRDFPLGPDGALSVVPVEGWERMRLADAWGRPFVPPSPNMPSLQTALAYPGACLLEGTNLSEGRGTTAPFRTVGAPFIDGRQLAQALGEVQGVWIRPIRFRPSFDKHAATVCGGVMLHVTDPEVFRPVEAYLRIIQQARAQAPDDFELLERVYEFETDKPAFDLLTGTPKARELLLGGASSEDLVELLCPVESDWQVRVEFAEDLVQEVRA